MLALVLVDWLFMGFAKDAMLSDTIRNSGELTAPAPTDDEGGRRGHFSIGDAWDIRPCGSLVVRFALPPLAA